MTEGRDRLDDPKLRFYLERRSVIDEWAQLSELEKIAACQFLRGLTADVSTAAEELDPEVVSDTFMLDGEELIALRRPSWFRDPVRDDEVSAPVAMVAIGWWPKSVRFEGSDSATAYIGLLVRRTEDPRLREIVGRIVHERRAGVSRFPNGKPLLKAPWVRYRYEPCSYANYWDNLGPYRQSLVAGLSQAWSDFAESIDLAFDQYELDK